MEFSDVYCAGKEEENGSAYRLVFGFCLGIHSLLLIATTLLGLKLVAGFNVISVLFYLLGLFLIPRSKHTPIWLFLFWLEVIVNAVLCNQCLGWGYGFTFYGVMLIPVTFFVAYFDKNVKKPIFTSTVLSVIDVIMMVIFNVYHGAYNKMGWVSEQAVSAAFCVNLFLCSAALIFYSANFILEMKTTTEKLHIKNEALNFLANYDELTKLRNRHTMANIFHEFEQGGRPFCVVLGDIDDFKKVNDTYGHACGDQVLIEISEIMRYAVGSNGVVCRWGGEEILILLDMEPEKGHAMMESIRETIEKFCIQFEEYKVNVTMTYGFTHNKEAVNVEKMVALADDRLYYGKKNGKNRIVRETI